MNIFFVASLMGREEHNANYLDICKTCERLGHTVISDHVFKQSLQKLQSFNDLAFEKQYQKLVSQIKESDVLIAEITYSSTTAGVLISVALQNHLPVLLLHQKQYLGLVIGDANRLIQIKTYSKKNLEKILRTFIRFAQKKRLHIRFNMMLDDRMNYLLTIHSTTQGISKAEYVRNLIQRNTPKGLKD